MEHREVWKTPNAGAINRLRLLREELPPLAKGQIRVKVAAVGLNFADIFALAGLYSATPDRAFVPGLEFSGIVAAVSDDCDQSLLGQRVMGVCRFGAYASVVDVAPEYVQPVPESWEIAAGAAFPVQTLTAWYALRPLANAKQGQFVLVQSAAGGVGLQALQIAKVLGLEIFGTVGTPEKKRFLEELGYTNIVLRDGAFPGSLERLLNGRAFDIVLDAIGGRIQKQCFALLAPTGRLIVYGAAEFTPGPNRPRYLNSFLRYLFRPRYDPLTLINDNKSVMGFNLIWLWREKELLLRAAEEIQGYGLPAPHIGARFPFAEAPAAVEHLRSGTSMGKVVLEL